MMRRLVRDRRGAAAIEFVLIAPVLISLVFGSVETVRYVRSRAALHGAATTMAELVAAHQSVNGATLTDLCRGAQFVLLPLPTASFAVAVSSYSNPVGSGAVAKNWEVDTACPSAAASPAAQTALAAATPMVPNRGDSVIAVSASYTYTPMVSAVLPSVTFQQQVYTRPRFGSVLCIGC